MILRIIRNAVVFGAVALAPLSASAVVSSGMFASSPTALNIGSIATGNAIADPFEDYGKLTATLTATEDLFASVTITINPYLTSSGGGFANSIFIDYQIDSGPLMNIPITQTNMTGSALVQNILLNQAQNLIFSVSGIAGPSGNDVDFNVTTSAIPVPPSIAMLLPALAGVGFLVRKGRKRASS